jgi:hypothetical protein
MEFMNTEIGVIRAQESVAKHAPLTIAEATEFTAELAERYAPQSVMVSRADLALAWEPPAAIDYYHDAPQIAISPSVTIEETYLFSGVTRELAAAAEDGGRYGESEARALFERLFARHTRVASFLSFPVTEAGQTLAPGMPPVRPTAGEPRAQAVERTLPGTVPENAPPARMGEDAKARPEVRDMGWGSRPLLLAEPKPVVLAAPEVRRVAEQVMREINHRVIAQRERMRRR